METRKRIAVYKKMDPEELVRLLAQNLKDRDILDQVFTEFHRRYAKYIENVIKKDIAFSRTFDEGELTSLAHDTLLDACRCSDRYKPSAKADQKEQERRVKAWLGAIAENMFLMYLRALSKSYEGQHIQLDFNDEAFAYQVHDHEDPLPREEIKLITHAFNKLSEQDRDILGTYLKCEDHNGKIEPYLHDSLSRDWNQLPQNLRKIKQRAIQKITKTILNPLKVIRYGNKSETSDRINVHTEAQVGITLHGTVVPGDTGTG